MDPFAAKPSLILFCDIIEPSTGQPYARDPRSTAKKAEAYVKSTGVGDTAFFGPEAEFFIFDSVKYGTGGNYGIYQIDSQEGPQASLKDYPEGNMGHRPSIKGGYFPVPPVDSESDLRAEMLSTMGEMGLVIEKHHHEVAQTQHELGMKFGPLVKMADTLQIYKYCIHNVAHSYGKTATFMPKPIYGDNGSGMHCPPVDLEGRQAAVRAATAMPTCRRSCAVLHRRHHQARQGAERLHQPGDQQLQAADPRASRRRCCWPIRRATARRPAASRTPPTRRPSASRCGSPIAAANPYLAFAAMLMAGLDGIKNKIHPGDPMDKDLYDLPPEELKGIPTVCGSLREAIGALEADHEFLLAGDVFGKDQIESYIELKWTEVYRFEHTPHPVEFEMYYSV